MANRVTKIGDVRKHLLTKGSITSMDAITLYGATRLSAIIFNLRKAGMNIDTITIVEKDRNGNTCQFAKYVTDEREV